MSRDPVLETLMLPLSEGLLPWPQRRVLFLQARDGWPLHARRLPGLACEQLYRPAADALERAGLQVERVPPDARFELVLVLPPRQREEARALLARAVLHAQGGGRVLACQANDEGARSGEADLAQLAGEVEVLSKNRCRAYWSAPSNGVGDEARLREWLALGEPRPIEQGRFFSQPGLFAWDRIDVASALLASHLPTDLTGHGADLGAGYGYLSHEVLSRNPGVTALDLFEADARGVALAQRNLAGFAQRVALRCEWADVTRGLGRTYDFIVTNPPFHAQGRADRPDIGRRFIEVAGQALKRGGRLWLVANRHLPYEAALALTFRTLRTVVQQQGYKVIEAVKA
jgi:16S rRNA (guanine1207-N2)-methyltransferase